MLRINTVPVDLHHFEVHPPAFPQRCDHRWLLPNLPNTKEGTQLCMHARLTFIMMAVVTASCQEGRRARRMFTPILQVIITVSLRKTLLELVLEFIYPDRVFTVKMIFVISNVLTSGRARGSPMASILLPMALHLDVRGRLREAPPRRARASAVAGRRSSNHDYGRADELRSGSK